MDTLFPCIKQSLTLVSLSICNFLGSGQPWNQDNCHLNRRVPLLVVTDPVEPSFSTLSGSEHYCLCFRGVPSVEVT